VGLLFAVYFVSVDPRSSHAGCGNDWDRFVPRLWVCATWCRSAGRTDRVYLGRNGGVFVRTSFVHLIFSLPTLTTLSTPPTPLQLTVLSWGNDGLGAHLRHFPTLRLVPNSTRGGEAKENCTVCSRSLGEPFLWCRRKCISPLPSPPGPLAYLTGRTGWLGA
jgi:hypothetical protein